MCIRDSPGPLHQGRGRRGRRRQDPARRRHHRGRGGQGHGRVLRVCPEGRHDPAYRPQQPPPPHPRSGQRPHPPRGHLRPRHRRPRAQAGGPRPYDAPRTEYRRARPAQPHPRAHRPSSTPSLNAVPASQRSTQRIVTGRSTTSLDTDSANSVYNDLLTRRETLQAEYDGAAARVTALQAQPDAAAPLSGTPAQPQLATIQNSGDHPQATPTRGPADVVGFSGGARLEWGGAAPFAPGVGLVNDAREGRSNWVGHASLGAVAAWPRATGRRGETRGPGGRGGGSSRSGLGRRRAGGGSAAIARRGRVASGTTAISRPLASARPLSISAGLS